jgi:hypothetical protein
MSGARQLASTLEARWQRTLSLRNRFAQSWTRHFGWPAIGGGLLLLAIALVQWQWRPSLQQEQQRLAARLKNLHILGTQEPAGQPAATPSPLRTLHELPPQGQRGRDIALLVEAIERSELKLERADYALAPNAGSSVMRVQATLPLTGTYAGVRRYVATVLNTLPNAALESLQLERASAQSPQLKATAKLVLFYRADTP